MSKTIITRIKPIGYGIKEVSIEFRGKVYKATIDDMTLIDAYNTDPLTKKQGIEHARVCKAIINRVKLANNLQ